MFLRQNERIALQILCLFSNLVSDLQQEFFDPPKVSVSVLQEDHGLFILQWKSCFPRQYILQYALVLLHVTNDGSHGD